MKKYSLGIDFGTKSGRAVLVDIDTGKEEAASVYEYPHGVIDEKLPLEEEVELGLDWVLQHPYDYLEVVANTIPAVLKEAEISPEQVISVGIDFTACTMLPVDSKGEPLMARAEFKENPYAWVKLWKHHSAQKYADRLNEIARERGEDFLDRYGGEISSEWMLPKVWETYEEAPEVYEAAENFMEAADWVIIQLTDNDKIRNISTAGYKAMWSKEDGFPEKDFFNALDPGLEDVVEEKLAGKICDLGEEAGKLKDEWAEKLKLTPEVSVAVANVDSFVSVPAAGVSKPNKMVMVMGTSICHMVIDKKRYKVEGMTGCIKDGIVPGFYGYEAGQSAVGDIFEWFINNAVPGEYYQKAEESKQNIFQYLQTRAEKLSPGENGLLALDWWNGNRSILNDVDITGLILGMDLQTKPEEIYRALIEATAFGTNKIIETFEKSGVRIDEIYACGGLPRKDEMLMQIYADVIGKEIMIAASKETPAVGAAMHGTIAAGAEKGGYEDIFEAAEKMGGIKDKTFKPIPENQEIYEEIYQEYSRLHDYFGRGKNNVMKVLKNIKREAKG
ncbi:MAG: ribulokinase [Halanaerobiaceae bacterium]